MPQLIHTLRVCAEELASCGLPTFHESTERGLAERYSCA